GPLDEAALERSWRAVVARHPSLRARIVAGAAPRQRFDVPFEAIWSRGDLSGVHEDDLPARLADMAHQPFDLERGPLFRVTLCASREPGPILLIAAHHIVA